YSCHSLFLAYVFIPNFGVLPDKLAQQAGALVGVEVNHCDSVVTQPVDAAFESHRFAHDHRSDPELPYKPAAVPARCERGNHDRVAVAALPARFSKGVGLAVDRWIILLDPPVMTAPQEVALRIEQRRADRDSAFGQSLARLFDCPPQESVVIDRL